MPTARDDMAPRHGHIWHAAYRKPLIAWCNLVLVLWICASHAAMLNISIEELARKADTIVLGTVTQQASAWDDQHTAIHTDVTVAVEQVLTGLSGEVVTLRVLGGVVGGVGMGTVNEGRFRLGERVVGGLGTSGV